MQSQETASDIVEQEKLQVSHIANLSDTDTITFNDAGWDSRVYMINNGEYFIKFPRSEKIRARSEAQILALELASGVDSDVTVPKVLWQDPAYHYFGYAGIEGTTLAQVSQELDEVTKERIGTALGGFLRQFHHLQLPEARAMGKDEEIHQLQHWYQMGYGLIEKVFSEDEQRQLHTLVYDIWPLKLAGMTSTPALCHGDFHFENIFYSPKAGVGVIDFGDVCNADASKDFADFDDTTIFEAALKMYGNKDQKLREKIKLREGMTRIITLVAKLTKDDEEAASEIIAKIKESFRQGSDVS